jgi:hypothetical protein
MITTLLIHLGVSVAVTVGVLLAALGLSRSESCRWALPLALAFGYVAGHALIRGWEWPPPAPRESVEWIAYLAILAGSAGVLFVLSDIPDLLILTIVGRFLLTNVCLCAMFDKIFQRWYGRRWGLLVAVLMAIWLAAWENASALAKLFGPLVALLLAVDAIGSAVVFWFSGSASLAALALVVATTVLAALSVGLFQRGLKWDRRMVGVPVVTLAGLITVGVVYSEVPLASALILAAAPAAGWIEKFLPREHMAAVWRWVVVLGTTTALVGVAIALAALAAPAGSF